jgi:1,4-dihydroxy-2-naphthoate octaprenyltransferase
MSINHWVYAARPKTLFIGLSPILTAAAFAAAHSTFEIFTLIVCMIGALSIQIATNYSNDYFDFIKGADTAERKGSKKMIQLNLISLKQMKRAFLLFFLIGFLCTLYLVKIGGTPIFYIGSACILFSLLYTSPPFPLAYYGLGDLFVLIFYGPVATLTTYYLLCSTISKPILIASLIPGTLGLGPLVLNNIRDYYQDKKAHKKTVVVRFGVLFGKFYYLASIISPFVITFYLSFYFPSCRLTCLITPLFFAYIPVMKKVFRSDYEITIQQCFIKTAKLIAVFILFFIALVLISTFGLKYGFID